MAQSKRPKSAGNEGKKKATAKQALKKKYLSNKSRNDDLREKLDREALALNTLRGIKDPRPSLQSPAMDATDSEPMADLEAILRRL